MGAKISGEEDDPIAEINIVPFVDIILVVLIIFMVTTPLIMKPSINVNLPEAASGEDSTPSKLNISISSNGEIRLNGTVTDSEGVKSESEKLSAQAPNSQAIISADKNVPHGTVVSIIDAVKSGGVKKFAITIDKK
ncbi:MAG: biopolymer transporter ExbD [Bdellovibrionaceae bacterium]|nr:biopolymer transporter ExbD [Pseudobdellovibrionaceae bacterium]|tara:strand:+ start:142522 stop:142929 length:408 start_codon:yes stop_codon:yes gene_type:complete